MGPPNRARRRTVGTTTSHEGPPPAVVEGTVAFRGHETWYRVVGDLATGTGGPAPLVTLHGGPGGTHDYLLALEDLTAAGRAVVFYDQLGNGRSTHLRDAPEGLWTFELFLDELDTLLDRLGIAGRYHLLGQSWGGFLGLEHAIRRPPGLCSFVCSNSAASYPDWAAATDRLRAELPRRSRPRFAGTSASRRPTRPSTAQPATSSTVGSCAGWSPGRTSCAGRWRRSRRTRPSTSR